MAVASTEFNSNNQLEIKQLSVIRAEVPLFAAVDFNLAAGESLQIRGANGAGKTSLLRAICGLSNHFQGDVLWNGRSIYPQAGEFQQALLYLGHALGLKPKLTAQQNLSFYRQLRFDDNADLILAALEQLGIGAYHDEYLARMSAGQKRRVALARIITEPVPLWVLDEPMAALDVHGQAWMEAICNQHLARGGILLITSHQPITGIDGLKQLELA